MKTYFKMRSIVLVLMTISLSSFTLTAQTPEKTMEKRARLLHETIKTKDNVKFEEFVNENYSDRLIKEYEMSFHTSMLERLNKDFSESKIISTKVKGNELSMVIERISDKHRVSFEISFDDKDEHKINGIGVEVGEM